MPPCRLLVVDAGFEREDIADLENVVRARDDARRLVAARAMLTMAALQIERQFEAILTASSPP